MEQHALLLIKFDEVVDRAKIALFEQLLAESNWKRDPNQASAWTTTYPAGRTYRSMSLAAKTVLHQAAVKADILSYKGIIQLGNNSPEAF